MINKVETGTSDWSEIPEINRILRENRDVNALVQRVIRQAYEENLSDLKFYAEKVKFFNEQKKQIRQYLLGLREVSLAVKSQARNRGIDICQPSAEDRQQIKELIDGQAYDFAIGDADAEICLPNRVPPAGVTDFEQFNDVIRQWEEQLSTVGDDAQLAQIDLQNMTQKMTQTYQMLSNISKSLHDSLMALIRNMKD